MLIFYFFLAAFSASLMRARTINMAVLEKPGTSEKRVILYNHIHTQELFSLNRQSDRIINSYLSAQSKGKTDFFLEAVEPQYKDFYAKINSLLYQTCQERDSLVSIELEPLFKRSIHLIIDACQTREQTGSLQDHVLSNIAQSSIGGSIQYVDNRNVIYSIHDLMTLLAVLPLCEGTAFFDLATKNLADIQFSSTEYFKLVNTVITVAKKQAQQVSKRIKNRANKIAIKTFISNLNVLTEHVQALRTTFTDEQLRQDLFKCAYNNFQNQFRTISNGLKSGGLYLHSNYIMGVLGETVTSIMTLFQDPTVIDLLCDSHVLAKILSPNASPFSFVVSGIAHGENINKILIDEGYTLLYSSPIKLSNGNTVRNLYEAENVLLNGPLRKKKRSHLMDAAFTGLIMPIEDDVYEYALQDAEVLKKMGAHKKDEL